MTSTVKKPTMTLASVEDYLGPGATRFFASGYRRVSYDFGELSITGRRASTTTTLTYPTDWSRKSAKSDLRPHLSTIDSLVLGVQLAECYLAHAHQLDRDQQRGNVLRRIMLQAGTTPQEKLDNVPLSANLRATEQAQPQLPGRSASSFDCSAGVMRARCTIEHDAGANPGRDGHYATVGELLGPAGSRYYGDGFKTRAQNIQGVAVDMNELRAHATATVHHLPQTHPPNAGTDGARQPLVTPVDCFVVILQLAQILMYEIDSIPREKTNTLWMLRTSLEAATAHPAATPAPAIAAITASHLLPLQGAHWRNVDIAGSYGGINIRCTFAHKLPT